MSLYSQPVALAEEVNALSQCRHHWIIETANGPVSRGMCRICQETREFRNSIDDAEREHQELGTYQRQANQVEAGAPTT